MLERSPTHKRSRTQKNHLERLSQYPRVQGPTATIKPQVIPTQVAPGHTRRLHSTPRPPGRQAGNQLHLLPVWEQKQEVCRIQVIELSELGSQASGSSWPGRFTLTVGPWACHLLTAWSPIKDSHPHPAQRGASWGATTKCTQQARVLGDFATWGRQPGLFPRAVTLCVQHHGRHRGAPLPPDTEGLRSSVCTQSPAPSLCLTVARGHYTPAASPRSPTQVKGPLLISRVTPLDRLTPLTGAPRHRPHTRREAWARERAPQHKKLKFEAHMGRTRGTRAPPYPKAAGKEGDWCSDRGHRAAGTGKGSESTKEKAS